MKYCSNFAFSVSLIWLPLICLMAIGCEGDTLPGGDVKRADATGGGGTDGGGGGGNVDPDCETIVGANGDGEHKPGQNCMLAGCHDGTQTKFTIAGTLYTDKDGTAPLAGATIVLTDANNAKIKLVSASNGNFYTSDAIAFPVNAKASGCPNSKSMTRDIPVKSAGCNQSGCHVAGKRIYVP